LLPHDRRSNADSGPRCSSTRSDDRDCGASPCEHLRGDGSLCATAGYDLPTRIFGTFDASAFTVPDAPTRTQAEQALATLGGLLDEFAFADPSDRSAALAALLTAAVRPSLPQAPMFHVRAHQVASGKSYPVDHRVALYAPDCGQFDQTLAVQHQHH